MANAAIEIRIVRAMKNALSIQRQGKSIPPAVCPALRNCNPVVVGAILRLEYPKVYGICHIRRTTIQTMTSIVLGVLMLRLRLHPIIIRTARANSFALPWLTNLRAHPFNLPDLIECRATLFGLPRFINLKPHYASCATFPIIHYPADVAPQVCRKKPPYSKEGRKYPTCGLTCAEKAVSMCCVSAPNRQ